jgi:Ca-activated chloride channel family protein
MPGMSRMSAASRDGSTAILPPCGGSTVALLPLRVLAAGLAVLALLAACSSAPPDGTEGGPGVTLRVLAGSELVDLQPILDEAAAVTGVRVELTPTGTLEGADAITSGVAESAYDATWFSSNRYVALQPAAEGRLGSAIQIMSSPVVFGLRRSVAAQLGWVGRPVGWSEIAAAAGARQFTYGMTDPSASNTGFSTVVAVSTALVGSGAALTVEQAASTAPALRDFFGAQTLAAGSSGFLVDAYNRRATGEDPGPAVDGLINYESVLLGMNEANPADPLELIYPADGVVTADYPLTVLSSASAEARDGHRRLAEYLRRPEVQQAIMDRTGRRPAVPGIDLPPRFGTAALVELPFPARADVVDTLLTSWFDRIRRPSRTIYVLDTSGSMAEGTRMDDLKSALTGLAGADVSLTGRYRQFRGREEVTLLPFSSFPEPEQRFTVAEENPQPDRERIAAAGQALVPDGDTAIYDSLARAYDIAAEQIAVDPDRFTSIVLMTDGENTAGRGIAEFRTLVGGLPDELRGVPVFTVLFGESANAEMAEVARLTGGRTFDARTVGLEQVFSEIRGYV